MNQIKGIMNTEQQEVVRGVAMHKKKQVWMTQIMGGQLQTQPEAKVNGEREPEKDVRSYFS